MYTVKSLMLFLIDQLKLVWQNWSVTRFTSSLFKYTAREISLTRGLPAFVRNWDALNGLKSVSVRFKKERNL